MRTYRIAKQNLLWNIVRLINARFDSGIDFAFKKIFCAEFKEILIGCGAVRK